MVLLDLFRKKVSLESTLCNQECYEGNGKWTMIAKIMEVAVGDLPGHGDVVGA